MKLSIITMILISLTGCVEEMENCDIECRREHGIEDYPDVVTPYGIEVFTVNPITVDVDLIDKIYLETCEALGADPADWLGTFKIVIDIETIEEYNKTHDIDSKSLYFIKSKTIVLMPDGNHLAHELCHHIAHTRGDYSKEIPPDSKFTIERKIGDIIDRRYR